MNEFENEEEITLDSSVGDESPTEIGSPEAPTIEETVGLPSSADQGDDEELDDTPLHEAVGSVLGLSDGPSEGEFGDLPDLYEDGELPPTDEEWEALPETPELEEQYEVETEDEELRRLDEDTFSTEDLGPVASESTILHYEVQARTYDEQPWETIARVNPDEELLEVADLPVGETWSFRIRTAFTNGEFSAWSAPSPVIFPEDMLAPGIPSDPVVVGNHAGIGVTWDGLDEDGRPMPPDFARVIIWQSPTGEDGTFERRASIPGAMEAILTGYDADEEHYFAFTAMDFAGNESGFSGIGHAARTSLVNVKEIEEELARLDQTDADLTEAAEELERVFGDMLERQDDFDDSIESAVGRLGAAEVTLAPLPADLAEAKLSAESARQAAEAAEARAVEAMTHVSTVLLNGGFEDGYSGWLSSENTMIVPSPVRAGASALRLTANGAYVRYDLPVPTSQGRVWELTGWYACGVGPELSVSFIETDHAGAAVRTVQETVHGGAANVWHNMGPLRVTSPAGAEFITIEIKRTSSTGNLHIDDIALRDVTDVVRLENAAQEARQKAEDALGKASLVELSIEGPGGLRSQLTQARTDISKAATSTELGQLEGKLTNAERLIGLDLDKLEADLERAQSRLENLIPWGDFEGDEQDTIDYHGGGDWTIRNATATNRAFKGERHLRYVHDSSKADYLYLNRFDVTPGRTYRVRFAVKIYSGSPGTGSGGFGQTWTLNDDGNLNSSAVYAIWGAGNFASKLERGEWIVLEGDAVAPANVKEMRPRLYFYTGTFSNGTIVYVDDLSITDVTELKELEAATAEAATTAYLDKLVVREGITTPEIVTGKLWADGLRANSAELARAVIAATNPIPHPVEDAETDSKRRFFQPGDDGFGHNQGDPSVWVQGRKTNYTRGTLRLEAGESYKFSVEVAGSVPNTRYYLDLVEAPWRSGGLFVRLASNELAGVKPSWRAREVVFEVPKTGDYGLRIWANHTTGSPAGASNEDGYQWFRGLSIVNMTHGSLIVENSITAKEINVTDKLITDLFGANRALIEDELVVKGELIANNADLIAASIRSLSVTEKANLVNAYASELYAEEFAARVASIAQLKVGSPNLIPGMSQIMETMPPPFKNSPFGRNTQHPSIWVRSGTGGGQGSNSPTTSADRDALIYLEEGEPYHFRVGVSANVAGTRAYIRLLDENGDSVNVIRNGSVSSYLLVNHVAGSSATTPTYYEAEFIPPASRGYRLRIYANHSNGTANPNSYQWFHGLSIKHKLDGQLLVDGTIKTRHIENTGDILTDALVARKIQGVDIDGSTFTGNTFEGGLFTGTVVQGGTVQTHSAPSRGVKLNNSGINGYNSSGSPRFTVSATTGDMTSHGGTLSGGTVTGGTVQTTATASRGVKMTSAGLKAYNASGRETVNINGANGNVVLDGGELKAFRITGSEIETTTAANRGVKINNSGLNAWDSSGNPTVRLNGTSNYISGRLMTARPGMPGVIIEPSTSNDNPGIFFTHNGTASGNNSSIVHDNNWHMVIRGKRTSSSAARQRIEIQGGIYVTSGNIIGTGLGSFTGGFSTSGGRAKFYDHAEFHRRIYLADFPTTTVAANVVLTGVSTGGYQFLWKTSSVRKNKVNIEDLDWDEDAVLNLRPRVWYDKSAVVEQLGNEVVIPTAEGPRVDSEDLHDSDLKRVPGLVAEEVEALGLSGLLTYDRDNGTGVQELSGIAYDRIAVALIGPLRRQRDRITAQADQIKALEEENESLEVRLAALEARMQ